MSSSTHRYHNHPIKRAHSIGTSVVVTIDPSHVRRLQIDDMTFFIQKPLKNGILLELRKLSSVNDQNYNTSVTLDSRTGVHNNPLKE